MADVKPKLNRPGARERGDTAVELEQRADVIIRSMAAMQAEAMRLYARAAAMRERA